MSTRGAAVVALLLAGVGGCDDPPARTATASTSRDSAGVTIVENSAPAWVAEQAWTLSEAPRRRIGSVSGDPETQLFRVLDAHMFADERIAVISAGTNDIRFFDGEGDLLAASGGEGEGPGEYSFPSQLHVFADSVFVYDRGLGRISVLSADGVFSRSFRMPEIDGRPPARPIGLLGDRTMLAHSPYDFGPDTSLGFQRVDEAFVRVSPLDGSLVARIGEFPGNEFYIAEVDGGIGSMAIPFSRLSVTTTAGDALYFGSNYAYEIDRYTPAGTLERKIRLDRVALLAGEAALDAFIANLTERAPSEEVARRMETHYREMPLPDVMPVYSSALVDAIGNLWVEDYSGLMFGPSTWSVFDRDGVWLGSVTMPDRFDAYQIGEDFVLGRYEGELDVEYVYVYSLRKP
jgi:hypothetical protein